MNKAYLLMGGNVGDMRKNLQQATELLEEQCGHLSRKSQVYETAPWGNIQQQNFYNQAVLLSTSFSPGELMKNLLEIEQTMGRLRAEKFGPRVIDIDILLFNNSIIDEPNLTIPHPQLEHRRFALTPLAEIAGEVLHPRYQKSVAQLLIDCEDNLEVNLVE